LAPLELAGTLERNSVLILVRERPLQIRIAPWGTRWRIRALGGCWRDRDHDDESCGDDTQRSHVTSKDYSSVSICQSASGWGPGRMSAMSGSTPPGLAGRGRCAFSARRAALSFCLAMRACSRCRFVMVGRDRCAIGPVLVRARAQAPILSVRPTDRQYVGA